MKYKITRRLILYFTVTLLVFSSVIGAAFYGLFTTYTTKLYKDDLEKRAETIANTLSDYMSNEITTENDQRGKGQGQSQGYGNGYGTYLRFIGDIAMSEVWLLDENAQTISTGHEQASINYSELPENAGQLVEKVFKGETVIHESFSINTPSLTVGAPVRSANGEVVAALLLHTHMEEINEATAAGIKIMLICLGIALILSMGISAVLAKRFIRPLKKMEDTTTELANGNYQMKTNVKQKDEIGALAENIDLLALRLDGASKESERLEKMRDNFITNISHELRTPVTVMRGSIEALLDKVVVEPEQVEEYYKQMLGESIYLQRMVNDLLELTRLQNIDYKIEKTQLNLIDIVDDAVRSMRKIAKDKHVDIQYEKKSEQYLIDGDYSRLRQMFIIVLDNAIKFSQTGQKIKVRVIQREKELAIEMIDFGCGIPKAELEYIFKRFQKTTSEANKMGTGLGLSIAKEIAERHEAKIIVSSTENEKTMFCFLFNSKQTLSS